MADFRLSFNRLCLHRLPLRRLANFSLDAGPILRLTAYDLHLTSRASPLAFEAADLSYIGLGFPFCRIAGDRAAVEETRRELCGDPPVRGHVSCARVVGVIREEN